jgi:4-hydroxy-2-oxoheptanedioate aldolase
MTNQVKEKLQNGEKVIGCCVGFNSPTIVEILGISGFDFVVIDNEHGPFSPAKVEHMVRAANSGTSPQLSGWWTRSRERF